MKFIKELYHNQKDGPVILSEGEFLKLKENFDSGVAGTGKLANKKYGTPITYDHDWNTGNVSNVRGFVTEIGYEGDTGRLWGELDIRDEDLLTRFSNGLAPDALDVSVGLFKQDDKTGWCLDHLAVVRKPAIRNMQNFIEFSEDGKERLILYSGIQESGDSMVDVAEAKEVTISDDLWSKFETYCAEHEIDALVEIENLITSYMEEAPEDAPEDTAQPVEELSEDKKKSLLEKIKSLFKSSTPEHVVEASAEATPEIPSEEPVIVEATEPVAETAETVELKAQVVELKTQIENLEKEKLDLLELKRVEDWEAVWKTYVGKKVLPREKEVMLKDYPEPEALTTRLELRADLAITDERKIEQPNEAKTSDALTMDDLTEEEKKFVIRQGWDKPGKNEILNLHLKLKAKEKELNPE